MQYRQTQIGGGRGAKKVRPSIASKPIFRVWMASVFKTNIRANNKVRITMYAIFWKNENGGTGNGEYILNEWELNEWLTCLRAEYPEMKHWGVSSTSSRSSPSGR